MQKCAKSKINEYQAMTKELHFKPHTLHLARPQPRKKSGFRDESRFFKAIDRSRFELETNCLKDFRSSSFLASLIAKCANCVQFSSFSFYNAIYSEAF